MNCQTTVVEIFAGNQASYEYTFRSKQDNLTRQQTIANATSSVNLYFQVIPDQYNPSSYLITYYCSQNTQIATET